MSSDSYRFKVSREEIGILLSFARKPEAATQEWVNRLQAGVSEEELIEFFGLAGLPLTEASRIMASTTKRGTPVDDDWSARSRGYRHAVLGVGLVYIVLAVALTVAAGATPLQVISLVTVLTLSASLLHKAIVRLSAGMG